MRYRDRDVNKNGEVSTLQDFLQSKGYLNNEPTGFFGILTLKAVKDFQKASGISPTGYVGPLTRAKIKALTCNEIIPVPTTPSITVLSPNGGETYKSTDIMTVKYSVNNLPISSELRVNLFKFDGEGTVVLSNFVSAYPYTGNASSFLDLSEASFLTSGQYRIQVCSSSNNYSGPCDLSDKSFTISSSSTTVAPPSLPEGCNSYAGFSTTTGIACFVKGISATASSTSAEIKGYLFGYAPTNVNFKYQKNGIWTPIATPSIFQSSNGYFSSQLNNLTSGTEYYFSACAEVAGRNSCGFNIPFKTLSSLTTTTPTITVLSPNGGEGWILGNRQEVAVNISNLDNSMYLCTQLSDGVTNGPLTNVSYPNPLSNGLKTIIVNPLKEVKNSYGGFTNIQPASYKVKVYVVGESSFNSGCSNINNVFASDISDSIFSVLPSGCTSSAGYSATTGLACNGSQG